jgi:hypothetical protein
MGALFEKNTACAGFGRMESWDPMPGCLVPQRDSLAQENAVLRTNISSLFRTAQLEMQRKTAEIAELRRR